MNFDKEYTHIIPIGSNCRIGIALRECGIRNEAMPLDWMLSTMKSVNHLFEDDFKDLTNKSVCSLQKHQNKKSVHAYILNEKYNLNITHEKAMNDKCIDKHNKRVNRMYGIMRNSDNKVLFIRNVLDGIVHDNLHKHYLSTEKDYSDSAPEHIEKFNSIVKEKFPNLEFDVLVINHTKPMEFSSDNIYNVTSKVDQTDKLWDQRACMDIVKKLKTNDKNK